MLDILLEQKYVSWGGVMRSCGCVYPEGGALAPPHREWVLKSGMLIAMSVYTYLRLIVDHGTPNLLPLRQKEVDFCTSMIREKVSEPGGRGRGRGSS